MTPAPLAAELQNLLPADARALVMPANGFRVRVARSRETRRSVVARAVPVGAMRAPSQRAWLDAVAADASLGRLRADAWANVRTVARLLAWTASWDSMTTRPTWTTLVDRSGLSRATVARILGRLRAAGLLGVVATGRSGEYSTSKHLAGEAEAAVYVLAVPSALEPVQGSETPTESSPSWGTHPPHAHARQLPSEPLRGALVASPAAPRGPGQAVAGPLPRPAGATEPDDESARRLAAAAARARRLDERLAPARALRSRLPVLRRITDEHVAASVREFVLAGWTVSELVAAIDRRPDGTAWHHDGSTGVGNVGAWLRFRLAAWRYDDGTVRPSPAQVADAERHRAAALRRARLEQLEPAGGVAGPDSPGLAAVRAQLAALNRRSTR